uniref:Transcription factor MYC/MYB N-terminal domain-containing protein n=1 Tax=Triticum urartu TaxID=4572 RepID=A0A8R7QLN5_TRIUA
NGVISCSCRPGTAAGEAAQLPARRCCEEHQLDLRHFLVHVHQPAPTWSSNVEGRVLQRRGKDEEDHKLEQLRELYESLLSGKADHRARRPAASLSPEDLGEAEWYTYSFRPGQGLPGKSFASNEHVWLYNAQYADTKTFQRALLAKTAPIQTVVCIPFMGGVLELGTPDFVR